MLDAGTLIANATSTVGSVLLVVAAGAIIVTRLTDGGAASLKGIGYVTGLVALPCLLYTGLASQFTVALFIETYSVMVFSILQILFGLLCAKIGIWLGITRDEYGTMSMLALMCPNAVAFPYAILSSVRGIVWYNGTGAPEAIEALTNASLSYGQTLLYVFNIWTSLVLWSVGNQLVKSAAEKESGNAVEATPGSSLTPRQTARRFFERYIAPALSVPVRFSLLGIFVGLIPPLRWLFTQGPVFNVVFGGMASAGAAFTPLNMLVLGCSLGAHITQLQQPNSKVQIAAAAAITEPIEARGNWRDFKLSQLALKADDDSEDETVGPSEFGIDARSFDAEARTLNVTSPLQTSPLHRGQQFDNVKPASSTTDVVRTEPLPTARTSPTTTSTTTASVPSMQKSAGAMNMVPSESRQPVPSPPRALSMIVSNLRRMNPFSWSAFARFTLWVLFVRSIVMPAVSVILALVLHIIPTSIIANQAAQVEAQLSLAPNYVDKQRVMLLVMLVQSFSPAAVQGGIIMTLHGYHQNTYSLMLALQYIGCILPCVWWLFVGYWILG